MILPGATIGLLGGGQLGRMFTLRARTMGYEVIVVDPDPASPAGGIATRHLVAAYDDPAALETLAAGCAVVTTEFENVPATAMERLASVVQVWPPPQAVAIAQDRIAEKGFLVTQGIATAPFAPVEHEGDLEGAWERIGAPALLKTSRLGYDGKGQATVTTLDEFRAAFDGFGRVPCVLERRLELDRELSVVLARRPSGEVAVFDPGENVHVRGILDTTVVPASVPGALAEAARQLAARVAHGLRYVGTLGVELFVLRDGTLAVNEIAPRPHNTGHHTLDACVSDQFEQHLRAICDLPLGETTLLSPVAMVNLLGDLWQAGPPAWDRALGIPGVALHLYGKRDPRPGRKMGHLTCLAPTPVAALAGALAAREAVQVRGSP